MRKKLLHVLIASSLLALIIIGMNFMQYRNPYLTIELEKSSRINDKISGDIYLNLNKNIPQDTPILIYLEKDNVLLITDTLTAKDISSDNSIQLESLIDYTFKEKGKYTLTIYIPSLDYTSKETFIVS